MTGTASSWGLSRITSGANDVVYVPRVGIHGRRAVVMCHGYLGTSRVFLDDPPSPHSALFTHLVAECGLTLIAVDVGNTWGSATASARIEQVRVFAGSLGAATDKIVLLGISMGHLTAMAYRRDYPTRVAGVVGVMPACDLNDIRTNNRASSQESIDAAWNVTFPAPLPAGADPTANAATLAGIPWAGFYSTGDTVVLPATVTTFASLMNGTTEVSGNADHGDGIMPSVSVGDVVAALVANGA